MLHLSAAAPCFLLLTVFCGLVYSQHVRQPRMIGGDPENEPVPYVVRIQHLVEGVPIKFCLGTIYNPRWIISSALCLLTTDPKSVVVDGGVNTHSATPSPNRYQALNIVIHPNFNSNTGEHDLALCQLSEPVDFKDGLIHATSLGQYQMKEKENTQLTAFGWNDDVEHGLGQGKPEGYQLARLKLTIISIEECQKKFPEINDAVNLNASTQFCGYDGKGKDMCGVDYGAPLINEETNEQVGVFNDVIFAANHHGHDCHPDHDHPLVFTKLEPYLPWIRETTNTQQNSHY